MCLTICDTKKLVGWLKNLYLEPCAMIMNNVNEPGNQTLILADVAYRVIGCDPSRRRPRTPPTRAGELGGATC